MKEVKRSHPRISTILIPIQRNEEHWEAVLRGLPKKERLKYEKLAKKASKDPEMAIRLHCLDCNAFSLYDTENCNRTFCALHEIRKKYFPKTMSKPPSRIIYDQIQYELEEREDYLSDDEEELLLWQ